jgi:hypothetical protein
METPQLDLKHVTGCKHPSLRLYHMLQETYSDDYTL